MKLYCEQKNNSEEHDSMLQQAVAQVERMRFHAARCGATLIRR